LQDWFRLEELTVDALGGPLEKFLGSLPMDLRELDIGALRTEDLSEVVGGILRGLSAERLETLVILMGKTLECQDTEGSWVRIEAPNGHFRRYMRDLIPCLVLFLEVNFRDFFGGALDLLQSAE
jgi:hypothetical protein